jgi:hypothetical protein
MDELERRRIVEAELVAQRVALLLEVSCRPWR